MACRELEHGESEEVVESLRTIAEIPCLVSAESAEYVASLVAADAEGREASIPDWLPLSFLTL